MGRKKIIAIIGATGTQGGGLVDAILDDRVGEFKVRAITRNITSPAAKALAERGAEIVAAELNNYESLRRAFEGAYGAFCVTMFASCDDPEEETDQAKLLAQAAADAGLQHVIWSTLEDSRSFVPLADPALPTLHGRYKVPHWDAKADGDQYFAKLGVPTTYLRTSFFFENLITAGLLRRVEGGALSLSLPLGKSKLAMHAGRDIGGCALGLMKEPDRWIDEYVGIASDYLTVDEICAIITEVTGEAAHYLEVEPGQFAAMGFPHAADMANMLQLMRDFPNELLSVRDIVLTQHINPNLQKFGDWAHANRAKISDLR